MSTTASVVGVLSDLYLYACKKYKWLPFARVLDPEDRRVPEFAYLVASACSTIASIVSDPKPAWATLVLIGLLVLGHFLSDARR
ncbi:hypothetical protein AURDEDRAFT_165099 [Auricularia subglabra TFB-10046 SS5]|nr:hypothetical protein AURDEDRAFT_165099 [Auricularia subglabra TFB-10046 SS5]